MSEPQEEGGVRHPTKHSWGSHRSSCPMLEPLAPPSPRSRGQEGAGWAPSTCPSWWEGQGRACTPRGCCSTRGPYSQLAPGALPVLVVQRCHLSQESQSNPGRKTR